MTFPTPVGLNRRLTARAWLGHDVPHTSGAEPRGCHLLATAARTFPTPVGLNRLCYRFLVSLLYVPHTSGAEPRARHC